MISYYMLPRVDVTRSAIGDWRAVMLASRNATAILSTMLSFVWKIALDHTRIVLIPVPIDAAMTAVRASI